MDRAIIQGEKGCEMAWKGIVSYTVSFRALLSSVKFRFILSSMCNNSKVLSRHFPYSCNAMIIARSRVVTLGIKINNTI